MLPDVMHEPTADETLDAPTEAGDLDAPTIQPAGHDSGLSVRPTVVQRIGDYEVIREIARGGMGTVYLAKQPHLNRRVALKVVSEGESASAEDLKRFENEAQAAGALDHPGIVPVYEVSSHQGCPFYAMAYVEGNSLASVLGEGPLSPERAARIARDVAWAIAHAHELQIVHRDIKPANILLDRDDNPKVTDFGVCKSLAAHSQLTSRGELIGTPHFMPPEQAGADGAEVGPAADVYSIGAVMYAMLTARPPFQAPSPIEVVAQVMTAEPVPPSRLLSSVPDDLETITLKCLAKSAKDRYLTAVSLAEDLERFLNGEPILAKPPGLWKQFVHAVRRHVLFASVSGTLALLLVILLALLSFAWFRSQTKVARLQELLEYERNSARQLISVDRPTELSRIEYDVRRLADAADRFAEDDPQLAGLLGVYAGRLSIQHDLTFPTSLKQTLEKILETELAYEGEDNIGIQELIDVLDERIERELTPFEVSAFGLDHPSLRIAPTVIESTARESIDENAFEPIESE